MRLQQVAASTAEATRRAPPAHPASCPRPAVATAAAVGMGVGVGGKRAGTQTQKEERGSDFMNS